jgi:two-component system, chemotaxis family, protein-glutamate methylesterase/glutaminase
LFQLVPWFIKNSNEIGIPLVQKSVIHHGTEKIRVLIVDDSSIVRQTLSQIITSAADMEIMGTAADPFIAAEKIRCEIPDVIILDVEMPRMDGITFLQKIMDQHPIPVVICSGLVGPGAETTLKALESGAVEIIQKPKLSTKKFLEEASILICDAVRAASMAKMKPVSSTPFNIPAKLSADAVIPKTYASETLETTEKVIVIGASTGGTEALRTLLESVPIDIPGIIIVQHMPEYFTSAFAKRLDGICRVTVKEAENNDAVIRGRVLIAPGNRHTLLKRSGARYFVEIKEGPLVNRHRPSVDVLFRSASRYAGKNAIGIILTGMGDDGAKGLKEMKKMGAHTIAQDEKTCVVFGMPNEAIKLGGVDQILSLEAIAGEIISLSENNKDVVRRDNGKIY